MTDVIDVAICFVHTGFVLVDCCLLRALTHWTYDVVNPSQYDRRVNGSGGDIWNLQEHFRSGSMLLIYL